MSREAQGEAGDGIGRELLPEAEMSNKDDHPDEKHSGDGGSVEEEKGVFGREDGEQRGGDHAGGGDGEGAAGNSTGAEMSKPARRVAASGEGEQHAGGKIKIGVGAGERGGDDDQVHDGRGVGNADGFKSTHEGAAGNGGAAGAVPGGHGEHDGDREHIKEDEAEDDGANGARDAGFGSLGFAGGHGDDFDAHVAGDGQGEGEPDSAKAAGEKSAVVGEIGEAYGTPRAEAGDQGESDDDEGDDGDDFDEGEPVFEFSEIAYLKSVHRDESCGDDDDPEPGGNSGKPERKIDSDGGDFGADGDDLDEAVSAADGESGPGVEVGLGINAEGSCDGMNDGHFGERVSHDDSEDRAEKIGNDDAGTGKLNCHGAAEEEADADGASDGDHGELARGEAAVEAITLRRGEGSGLWRRVGGSWRCVGGVWSGRTVCAGWGVLGVVTHEQC